MEIDSDPYLGDLLFSKHSSIQLAVSHSGDPTAGYTVYAIDTTDASKRKCPCFGDRPLLGADANGLFLSTNEFVVGSSGPTVGAGSLSIGAQIYALSKTELAKGTPPTIVHVDTSTLPGANPWYSIQPAVAPGTSVAGRAYNGTEYFLSALNFAGANDNRICNLGHDEYAIVAERQASCRFAARRRQQRSLRATAPGGPEKRSSAVGD